MLERKGESLYEYAYNEGIYIGKKEVRFELILNKFYRWIKKHPDFDGDWKRIIGTKEGMDINIILILLSDSRRDQLFTTADKERLDELLMFYEKYPTFGFNAFKRKVEKYSEFKYI